MPRKNKRNGTGGNGPQGTPQNSNQKKQKGVDTSQFLPSQILAEPKQYLNIPRTLKCQTEYASAALMGLTSSLIDERSKHQAGRTIELIDQNCPTILADAKLAREFLVAADDKIIQEILKIRFGEPRLKLVSHIPWNPDLARLAIGKSPFFYQFLPEELKKNNDELAFATLFGGKLAKDGDLENIVTQLRSSCSGLFSSASAMKRLLDSRKENIIMNVLASFGDKIAWDQETADVAVQRFPAASVFLPAAFRKDGLDAQHVMASLMNPNANVDNVISAYPAFFSDAIALKEVFRRADKEVVSQIVASLCTKLPWDRDLVRLATRHCYGDYYFDEELSMVDKEVKRMYKGEHVCKNHLPLGMLVSYVMAEKIVLWPDFLNHCRCALVHDSSVLLAALNFMDPMLLASDLSEELSDWLQGLADPIKLYYQDRGSSFQTLLKCITVAGRDGQEPLSLLPKDVETSNALKQKIAEFLVGSPVKAAEMKQDALQLVYCVLTTPSEFVNEMGDPSDVFEYKSPHRVEEATFYCEWCCDALAKLDEKYNGNHNNRKMAGMDDDDEDSDEDDEH
jgi:hypothetical protein